MKAVEEAKNWFEQILKQDDVPAEQSLPTWLIDYRQSAKEAFKQQLMPHRKQEAWRYTSLNKLQENSFHLASNTATIRQEIEVQSEWLGDSDNYRVVFVDGCYRPELSQLEGLPESCYLGSLSAALTNQSEQLSQWLGQAVDDNPSIFTQLNNAMIKDGLFLYVPAGLHIEAAIEVLYISGSLDSLSLLQPRNLVVLEDGAQATLCERFISLNEQVHFNNVVSEVFLSQQAVLNHIQLQQQNRQAFYINQLHLSLAAQSDYTGTYLAIGSAMARTELNLDFKQAAAKCCLNGLYTVADAQLLDFHLNINHAVPGCHSHTNFKGVLFGKGRAVFDGSIVIAKDAQKSEAHLSNDNLLLTRKAEIDTKPQLEIYADDVKCSHGTTVGQLEEEQVFYLRSRGFNEQAARKILAMGFAREVLANIKITTIKDALEKILEGVF